MGARSLWCIAIMGVLAIGCRGSGTGDGSDGGNDGGSDAGSVDLGRPLTPEFSTFLGGTLYDSIRALATDDEGNVYFAGGTPSTNFPTTGGSYQPVHHPGPPLSGVDNFDVIVGKVSPSGQLLWSTFIGGPNYERAYGIALDAAGFVYVAGRAGPGFPVTTGAFQTVHQGGQESAFYGPEDGFVCKLQPDGSAVVFCSFFGTDDPRIVRDIAVSAAGDIYLASACSNCGGYPAAIDNAFVNSPIGGSEDAVFARIATDGSHVVWATYLGGTNTESSENSVRLDGAGNPYVLFTTSSSDVPTPVNAYDRTYAGNGDLFVAKLNPANGAQVWGTYLGASGNESTETHELAVDPAGHVYVGAPTTSTDFPTTAGVVQTLYGGGGNDMFVAKLALDGTHLVASTFYGGNANDRPEGVAVDADGNVYLTGVTGSPNFFVTPDAFRSTVVGTEAVVLKLSSDLTQVLYASTLGGSGDENGRTATVDASGNFFLGGDTASGDFSRKNAYQPNIGGAGDAFLARFAPAP